MLYVFLIILNPSDTDRDVVDFINKTKHENIWTSNSHKLSCQIEIEKIRNKKVVVCCQRDRNLTLGDSNSEETENKNNNNKLKEMKFGVSIKMSNYNENLNKESVMKESSIVTNDSNWSFCQTLLPVLKQFVTPTVLVDIITFVSSCDRDPSDSLNKNVSKNISHRNPLQIHSAHSLDKSLSKDISQKNLIQIGHYILKRRCIVSYIKDTLLKMHENILKGEMDELSSLLKDSPQCSSLFGENGKDQSNAYMLRFRRTLDLMEKLDMVKNIVKSRARNWQEILCDGMKETDMANWWNAGFYDLVWENVDWLSDDVNTKRIIDVLHHISITAPYVEADVESMTKLFNSMYSRLPLLLQEHLVMSSCAVSEGRDQNADVPSDRDVQAESLVNGQTVSKSINDDEGLPKDTKDVLANLKSEDQVLNELIPLLNKLTVKSVGEIAPSVLKLCLYQSRALLRQMLQVAIRNSGQILPVVEMLRQVRQIGTSLCPGTHQSRLSRCLSDVLMKVSSFSEKETENVITLMTQLTMDYVQMIDLKRDMTTTRQGILNVEEVLLYFIFPGLDLELNNGNFECDDTVDAVLSTSVSLSCLTSLIKSIHMKRFDSLKFLVLVQAVVEIFSQNYTVCYTDVKKYQNLVTKQNAYTCVEALIGKACMNNSYFSEMAVKCLQDQACQSSLLALALCHPLLHEIGAFNMVPILKAMAEEEKKQMSIGMFQAVVRLLPLGLVNKVTCDNVCEVFQALEGAFNQKHLTASVAHILSQSLPCQMVWLPKVVMTLIGRMAEMKSAPLGPRGELVPEATRSYLWYVEILYDALLVLHSRNTPDIFLRHFVSNFQAAIQALLSEISQEDAGMPDLSYFLFHRCCTIMCCLSGDTTQGIHVLAITVLSQWSNWLRLRNVRQGVSTTSVVERTNEEFANETGLKEKTLRNRGKKELRLEIEHKLWNLEDLLTLRDVVVCVKDENVQAQLLKQLETMSDVFR